MEWDEANGVWKGNAAASKLESIPNPLYIFGYGYLSLPMFTFLIKDCFNIQYVHDSSDFVHRSLLWKPGETMGQYESFPCCCSGFIRLFAQVQKQSTIQYLFQTYFQVLPPHETYHSTASSF